MKVHSNLITYERFYGNVKLHFTKNPLSYMISMSELNIFG